MTDVLARALQTRAELPMTMRAFALLREALSNEWLSCPDPARREELWFRVKGLQDAEQMLVAAAAEADLAEHRDELAEQGFQP